MNFWKNFWDGVEAGATGVFMLVCVWLVIETFIARLEEMTTLSAVISLAIIFIGGNVVGWKFLRRNNDREP